MAAPKGEDPQARKPVSEALRDHGASVRADGPGSPVDHGPNDQEAPDVSEQLAAAMGGADGTIHPNDKYAGQPGDPQARQPVTEALRDHGATIRGDAETTKPASSDPGTNPETGKNPDIDPYNDNNAPDAEQDDNSDGIKNGDDPAPSAGAPSIADDASVDEASAGLLQSLRTEVPAKYDRFTREELEQEVLGWPDAKLPRGHQLTDDQLRQYLGYLNAWAENGNVLTDKPVDAINWVDESYEPLPSGE